MKLPNGLFFLLCISFNSLGQQKKSPPGIANISSVEFSSYRIGCSLFNNPDNYNTGSSFTYNAPINNNSYLTGPNNAKYGCLYTVPNQAWFIIEVNSSGSLYFRFTNSKGVDVDAAIWGPIQNAEISAACTSVNSLPITCDYDAFDPDLSILNAQAGQKYIMLVTNYSNAITNINISQPTGGSVTYHMLKLPNCSNLPTASISGSSTINEGQSTGLTLNFSGESPWIYSLSDGSIDTAKTTPLMKVVTPVASTNYTITSVRNVCGTGNTSGNAGVSVARTLSLKSCYPFDGDSNDSKNVNNGVVSGTVLTTDRQNQLNKSYYFNGLSDYISASANQFNNSTFGFSSWVKLDDLPLEGEPQRIIMSMGNSSSQHYLSVDNNGGEAKWKFSSNGFNVYSNRNLETNHWHFLVGIRRNTELLLYIDGEPVNSKSSIPATSFEVNSSFRIGCGINNDQFFKGKIDDVKIYQGAIILPEIKLNYAATTCNDVTQETYIYLESLSSTIICTDRAFGISVQTANFQNVYDPNLSFMVELSDTTGSFANPIILANASFLPINSVTIPANLPQGNYKVRIRYGNLYSINVLNLVLNKPIVATFTGTSAIQDGQNTALNINWTGTFPFNYVINGENSIISGNVITNVNPTLISVTPERTTTYFASISNVCGAGTVNGTPIITVIVPKQLITCLPFNGNANDTRDNNFISLIGGPLLIGNRIGASNAAYLFNGSNDYMKGTTNNLRKQEYTMSAWVFLNELPTSGQTRYVISIGDNVGSGNLQGLALTATSGVARWAFVSTNQSTTQIVEASGSVQTAQWIHLTAVRKNNEMRLYINGASVGFVNTSSYIVFKDTDSLRVGGKLGNNGITTDLFKGVIDDVRLYKGALNDTEVAALYYTVQDCPVIENAPIAILQSITTPACAGQNITIAYNSNLTVSNSNPLRVELSNSLGSFANPTLLGTGTSNPLIVPISSILAPGSGYRVRITQLGTSVVTSINSLAININSTIPTATLTGTATIGEGAVATLTINFSGTGPWTYALNGGSLQTTSNNPQSISVTPITTTTYSITSVSNVACNTGTGSGSATVTVIPIANRLISCYPFNGNANDSQGSNNGVANNATLTTDRFGNPNSAYYFGSRAYVQIPILGMKNSAYTYSVWFSIAKPDSQSERVLIDLMGHSLSLNYYQIGEPLGHFNYRGNADGSMTSIQPTLRPDTWYQATITRDGRNFAFYLNGILQSGSMGNADPVYGYGDTYIAFIGAMNAAGGALTGFEGKIDDVKIFKGSLNAIQVMQLYRSSSCEENRLSLGTITDTVFCQNQALSIPFFSIGVLGVLSGNAINVELSDASGGFSNPTVIGSGNVTPISAQIPTVSGSGYKIRLRFAGNSGIISDTSSVLKILGNVTATISGDTTIFEESRASLKISFTGAGPRLYSINGGAVQTASSNPEIISLSPLITTTYTLTSINNGCNSSVGIGSATIRIEALPAVTKLVSCYPFNGNANDSRGINNGTAYNVTLTTDRFGNPNSAYLFSGNNSYIQIPTNQILNSSYTYSLWFSPPSDIVLYSRSIIDIMGHLLELELVTANPIYNYATYKVTYNGNSDGSANYNLVNISSNQWFHIVITCKGKNFALYLNGILVNSSGSSGVNSPAYGGVGIQNAFIGRSNVVKNGYPNDYLNYFIGKIDEVKIFKGALIADQVAALYLLKDCEVPPVPCLESQIISSVLDGQEYILSRGTVTSNSLISAEANITFDAKMSTQLLPGFEAKRGSVFNAQIGGCN
ncbi:LamG domain-containing protein [Runella sp.]|uniref:LamG domain-containing protein n=1 Tax=Runella sp. TaxID=1960881 RepID=UPI003D143D91